MKKAILLLALALAGAQLTSAQDVKINGRTDDMTVWEWELRDLANRGYTNFYYVTQKMIEPVSGTESDPSKWGAAISKGRNLVLHRRPIAGVMFVALNANWVDINYAQYGITYADFEDLTDVEMSDAKMHQLDISVLGVGPSIHVMPVGRLGVHAYFRYQPGYGAYAPRIDGEIDYVMGGLVHGFVTGGALSWGALALGAEARWGTGNYKMLTDDETYLGMEGKLKTSGIRAYLSLRF
jgi:hypothetical protein